jgi:AbrB family looped-hinge helix DNA binding protein
MGAVTVKVDASGRVVIPKDMREALGILEGGELELSVEEGELRGITRLAALHRLQKLLRGSVPPGVSMVDELIAERRAEAAREEAEAEAWQAERRRRGQRRGG